MKSAQITKWWYGVGHRLGLNVTTPTTNKDIWRKLFQRYIWSQLSTKQNVTFRNPRLFTDPFHWPSVSIPNKNMRTWHIYWKCVWAFPGSMLRKRVGRDRYVPRTAVGHSGGSLPGEGGADTKHLSSEHITLFVPLHKQKHIYGLYWT